MKKFFLASLMLGFTNLCMAYGEFTIKIINPPSSSTPFNIHIESIGDVWGWENNQVVTKPPVDDLRENIQFSVASGLMSLTQKA